MSFSAKYIPYKQTGAFSKIVTDYLDHAEGLRPFYNEPVSFDGIRRSIENRKAYPNNRKLLVEELRKQYAGCKNSDAVKANIESLLSENTFTICTAHQPNIFTGHLYFIYKILHAVKLAEELKTGLPGYDFVPMYYMGSEDADLEELGEVTINGKKYQWETDQTGAVGRMKIDKAFIKLTEEIENQLSVEKYGPGILQQVKEFYTIGKTIQQATFEFVHSLFADYGLIVFLPDNPAVKKVFTAVDQKELTQQFSQKLVAETIARFPEEYKVQVAGREINLFYLKDDKRERISKEEQLFKVQGLGITFTEPEILKELELYPERFSQNVILRPVFQEMILPNIAFIGGGGELAYWLELKSVFEAVAVPFPVLILRNSFLVVPGKVSAKITALKFEPADFFKKEYDLVETLVKRESAVTLQLNEEKSMLKELYGKMSHAAAAVDLTLQQHTMALFTTALKRVEQLEKKMLKAEKKKFEAQQRQVHKIKEALFPSGILQERIDNLLPYYAAWGPAFIPMLYKYSTGLKQEFCMITEEQ